MSCTEGTFTWFDSGWHHSAASKLGSVQRLAEPLLGLADDLCSAFLWQLIHLVQNHDHVFGC